LVAGLLAWFGATRVERNSHAGEPGEGDGASAAVLNEGVLCEAQAGDPGVVVAKDVGVGCVRSKRALTAIKRAR
jgi:hypothetical protein